MSAGERQDGPFYVMTAAIPSDGRELFREYEDRVLPLLADHGGRLVQRLRGDDGCTEVHVVSFPDTAAFERYRDDPRRLAARPLLERSKAQITLLHMTAVGDA